MSALFEQAHWFGPTKNLLGIVTLPPPGTLLRGPGIVLMNPGTLHRVGGARLNVRLARRLSAQGFASIRFDLSGLGDSEPRHDVRPYLESMAFDVQCAMDHLTTLTGLTRFALVGHCSGAAVSYTASVLDARVMALVQIEGFAYRTPRYQLYRWRRILFKTENWSALLRGEKNLRPILRRGIDALLGKKARANLPAVKAQSIEAARGPIRAPADLLPPQAEMKLALGQLIGRRVRMLNIFAGGDHHYYSYRGQFADAFVGLDFMGLLEVDYVADADHYFSAPQHQAWLDERIAKMIEKSALDI